jgi:3-oxoacyl-[acyl-carrier protein] reductase
MEQTKKVAVITGGATGIGKAIAIQLAKEGYAVVITFQSSETSAVELKAHIESEQGTIAIHKTNVSSLKDVDSLLAFTLATFGRVDVLVNNAGITDDTLMLRMQESQFDRVIETNLKGVWVVCKTFLRTLLNAPNGRIINIASVSGMMGNLGQANYAASKAGVIGLSKTLAREVASRQVTVNVIAPGFIETKMTAPLNETIKAQALSMIPLKSFGQPEDIAYMVSFLASDKARYITGQTLVVDGGLTMY